MKVLAFIFILGASGLACAEDTLVVTQLNELLKTEEDRRPKADGALFDGLKDMQSTNLLSNASNADVVLERHQTRLSDLKNAMLENHLRIEFLNDFIPAISQMAAKDVRHDSIEALRTLAHNQILSNIESGTDSSLWLFEIYLSMALRDILEPSENYVDFIKKYMAYSSLRDPRSPIDFIKNRSYIGGDSKADDKYLDLKASPQ